MKGIYLTEEGKQEIEAKIAELKEHLQVKQKDFTNHKHLCGFLDGQIDLLQEILSSATILSVEESWEDVELYPPDNESQFEKTLRLKNGVIIQPKQ
jgi:transcription elongation GreA/GreB family factor